MIITISGTPGSGKSTVGKIIAKSLNLKHFSAGDFMRQMAQEKGISLMELGALAEKDNGIIDKEIDTRTEKLAETQDDFVIDSRLAFHFISRAIKIFLDVDPKIAAKRTWKDIVDNKRSTENQLKSEEEVYQAVLKRTESEVQRYKNYYHVDYLNPDNYDLFLDTTNLSIEQVVDKVLEVIKSKK